MRGLSTVPTRMEKYIIQYILLIITACLLFAQLSEASADNITNSNVTFKCDCENVSVPSNQNTATYNCSCQTYLWSANRWRPCFYDCNNENYTCHKNETCEKILACRRCHKNATCKKVGENYDYNCTCEGGFKGNGTHCEPCKFGDCQGHIEPELNCTCENKTYCCTNSTDCPANCPNCQEQPCFRNFTTKSGNLTCWCNATCDRVHGNFSNWGNWSKCSEPCGVGKEHRTRNCSSPAPYKGGRNCTGNYTETRTCNLTECPTVSFSRGHYIANEGDNVTLQVDVVSGTVVEDFIISIQSWDSENSAKKEEDYSFGNQMLNISFTPGNIGSKSISIPLIDDNFVENNESFSVSFTVTGNKSVVHVKMCSASVTIVDNDTASVSFESSNYSVSERDRGVNVTVVLSGNIAIPVTARLKTINGTAEADKDYSTLVNKSVTFQPGGNKTIDIETGIVNDTLVENNETFSVTLTSESSPSLVVAQPSNTTITIEDDDMAKVRFEHNNYSVREDQGPVMVKIILAGNITIPVTARLTSSDISVGAGNDYVFANIDKTFHPNGNDTIDISISITDDLDVEMNETFSVTLSSRNASSLIVVSPSTTVITIVNDDVDGNFTNWGNWSKCIRTCGVENQTRERFCRSPEPKGGGKNCTKLGNATETRLCNITVTCPGSFNCSSTWSNWTACNVSCGPGYQSRNRTWSNVVGEKHCNGNTTEIKLCNMGDCPVISNWGKWTPCNASTGGNRTRSCSNTTGYGCSGKLNETGPCPVDGSWQDWGDWRKCSKTCGSGVKIRKRNCNQPQYGGKECPGNNFENFECDNPDLCQEEQGFSHWSGWSECSVTCEQGIRTRTRSCVDGAKSGTCNGTVLGNKTCDMGPCPVDGNYSAWGQWSDCPGSCGSSFVNRTRKCDNPAPQHGGANCSGLVVEIKECNHSSPCTGESGFTQWSTWSPCTTTCGDGFESRNRHCSYVPIDSECVKETSQEKPCYIKPCPVNGGWSAWLDWSRCSSSCGSAGVRLRKRTCTNPKRSIDGLPCYGKSMEETVCVMPDDCPVDYAYRVWESWSKCNASCGYGKRVRKRECNILPKYPPQSDPPCTSPSQDNDFILCFTQPCSIDGNFTQWSFWSRCSVACGDGVQKRTRDCSHPPPSYGGKDCTGKKLDVKDCYTNKPCPDDHLYKPWSAWSNCSKHCEGRTERTRDCNSTSSASPRVVNTNCTALNISKDCNTELCDIPGGWSEWTTWSSCDLTRCGEQHEYRQRFCNKPKPQAAGNYCLGDSDETTVCSDGDAVKCGGRKPAGWTDWSWWKPCSKSCDGGVKSRHRKCSNPPPESGGSNCTGNSSERVDCNTDRCPVNGNFTEWTPWTHCTKECENGTRTRNRTCTKPEPKHGGANCVGLNFTREFCNVHFCPIHGNFSAWSRFSFCSKPCNRGLSIRTRSCSKPAPKHGGRLCSCNNTVGIFSRDNCTDDVRQNKSCNDFVCPPVKIEVGIDYNNLFKHFDKWENDNFKRELVEYITEPYRIMRPVIHLRSCRKNGDIFTCAVVVQYNFSDGDQLPVLRDHLEQPPGSNVTLLWMNSSVVLAADFNITAVVLSSTSIKVNWSIPEQEENVTSIFVFYKTLDSRNFQSQAIPTSLQGGFVIENLMKFTPYKITVAPTTVNGTGIPSSFVTLKSFEDVPSEAPQIQVNSPNSTSLNITWYSISEMHLHGRHCGYCLYFDDRRYENTSTQTHEKIITDLKPYTNHYVQVAARTTPGCGVLSRKMSFTTLEDKPAEPPQHVSAHNESSTSVRVDWKEVNEASRNGKILGYKITYNDTEYVNVSAPTLHTVISGLSVWTEYNVSVAAYTKIGLGPPASVRVWTEEGTPTDAPKIIVAKNESSSSIYIKWRAIDESGYGNLLGYRITWIPLDLSDQKEKLKEVGRNTLDYLITELYFYWRYEITISGFTRPGFGVLTSRIFRTDEHPPGRSPENVRGIPETSTSISVEWDEVTSNFVHGILLSYNLTIRKKNDGSLAANRSALPNDRSQYVGSLQKFTKYTIWVRAVNSKGQSKLNRPEGYPVRTKEDAPEAPPSNIRVKTLTSISTLNLEWERIPEKFAHGIIRGYYVEYTATKLNGENVEPEKRVTKTIRVRGNRYATILKNLIPGSTYEIRMFGYTIKNGTKSVNSVIGETCRCPEYLKVNWWNIPPYTDDNDPNPGGIFSRTVNMMLDMCGMCTHGHGRTKACYRPGCDQSSSRRRRSADTYQQKSFQEVLNNIKDDVDISFPIQGNKYMTHYGGVFPYISVVETSGSVFFTVKKVPSTSHVLINAAFYSIPLLILVTLLSILAGIIIWALERSSNPTSFPLSFTKGLKEGFWWAFISASTVGYGDRRPVTIPGKLFAILWILVGYVIITLLTSLMVNSITSVLVTQSKSIYGARVAAIQNSTEHGKAIRQNGRVVSYSNVDNVIMALKDKVVDGALLDMYAAATRKDLFEDGDIVLSRQVEYPSGYGIVLTGRLKHSAPMINEHFKKHSIELVEFIQNRTDVVTQKQQSKVKEAAERKSGIFDASSNAYQLAMIIIISLLTASLAGGLFWQVKYHGKAVKNRERLRNSTPGYQYYKNLREDVKESCEEHFQELMTKLQRLKQRHVRELKLLAKYYKNSGRPWPVVSRNTATRSSSTFSRMRKMTASVTPALNSRCNIALQVMHVEKEQEKRHSNDSQV